jgi:hypothetical protein
MKYYKQFWDYQPSEPYNIFVEDFGDWANGGATAVPRNFVYVSIAPYMYVFDVAPANERMSLLMHHELVHVIAMDKATRRDRFWRKLYFGKVQQTASHPISCCMPTRPPRVNFLRAGTMKNRGHHGNLGRRRCRPGARGLR